MEIVQVSESEGKDKVESMTESETSVILVYNDKSGNLGNVEVPRKIINFTGEWIDSLNIGVKVKSVELYEDFIRTFNLKSKISEKHLQLIKQSMENQGFDSIRISYVLDDLKSNPHFCLMSYKEFIGSRKKESAEYFKVWGAIRYWKEKGKISYTSRGTIIRII